MKHLNVVKKYGAGLGVGGLLPLSAFAAVPTEVTDMFTDLATDFAALLAAGFVLLAVVVGGLILMTWSKKVAKKAS